MQHTDVVAELLVEHPTLRPYGVVLAEIGRLLDPPAIGDYPVALAALLDLHHTLGPGWQVPIVSKAEDQSVGLLGEIARLGLRLPATQTTPGLIGRHPAWVVFSRVSVRFSTEACLLGLMYFCKAAAPGFAKAIERLLRVRNRESRAPDSWPAALLEPLAPTPDPISFLAQMAESPACVRDLQPSFFRRLEQALAALGHPQHALGAEWEQDDDNELAIVRVPVDEEAERLPGEPLEEATDSFVMIELDDEESRTDEQMQFTYASRRFRAGGRMWIPDHISVLPTEDATVLCDWLIQQTRQRLSGQSPEDPAVPLVTLIMLMAGRSVSVADDALRCRAAPITIVDRELIIQLPELDKPYSPPAIHARHYVPAKSQISVPIPPRVAKLINSWRLGVNLPLLPSPQKTEEKQVISLLHEFRQQKLIPASMSQVRQTLATCVYDRCRDPVIAIWLSGDLQGHSDAPLYYVAIPETLVRRAYVDGMWPILAPRQKLPTHEPRDHVGCSGRPSDSKIARQVGALDGLFRDPTFRPNNLKSVVDRHNAMVFYVTLMLVCLIGHRPFSSLFRLRRWDFSLDTGLAIIADKDIDPAHMLRPVALGKKVSEQLQLYQWHLQELSESLAAQSEEGRKLAGKIQRAQAGRDPWFFRLDAAGLIQKFDLKNWKKQFKARMPGLQENYGRTAFPSQAREIHAAEPLSGSTSCAELAHIQLGHLSLLAMPFDSNSPTELVAFARDAGEIVDRLFDLQGWKIQGGLVPYAKRTIERRSKEPTPADWFQPGPSEKALSKQVSKWRKRRKAAYEQYLTRARARFGEPLVTEIFGPHPELANRLRDQLDPQHLPGNQSGAIELTPDQLSSILSSTWLGKNRPAITNVLEDELMKGQKAGWYRGPLPKRFAPTWVPERTRYLSGMFRAHRLFQELRQCYAQAVKRFEDQPSLQTPAGNLARVSLALILFGGIKDRPQLTELISARDQALPNPLFPGGVLVPMRDTPPRDIDPKSIRTPMVWALWHIAAVELLRTSEPHPGIPESLDWDDPALNDALGALLDGYVRAPRRQRLWIDALLEQAEYVQKIEMCGIGEYALKPKQGSWSLPLSRQYALLAGELDRYTPQAPRPVRPATGAPKAKSDALDQIRKAIPYINSEDQNGVHDELIRTRRASAVAKVNAILANLDPGTLEHLLALWALDYLQAFKANKKEYYELGGIRAQISSIGEKVQAAFDGEDIAALSFDEYQDIYQKIISYSETPDTRKAAARELIKFHAILCRELSAPSVSRDDLVDDESQAARVDARIVLPAEIRHAQTVFSNYGSGGNAPGLSTDLRVRFQAGMLLDLCVAAGPRPPEAANIKSRDFYQAGQRHFIILQTNKRRKLKTNYSRRRIRLTGRASAETLSRLSSYQKDERTWFGVDFRHGNRLFFMEPTLSRHARRGLATNTSHLTRAMSSVLQSVSPEISNAYHIRHAVGTRSQALMALGASLALGELVADKDLRPSIPDTLPLRLPRDAGQIMAQFGHIDFQRTNRSYGHVPWVYLFSQSSFAHQKPSLEDLAVIYGRTLSALRKVSSQPNSDFASAVIRKRIRASQPEVKRRSPVRSKGIFNPPVGSDVIGRFLFSSASTGGEVSYVNHGLTEVLFTTVQEADREIYEDTGVCFLRNTIGAGEPPMPLPMIPDNAVALYNLVEAAARSPEKLHLALKSFLLLFDRARKTRIRLEAEAAKQLEGVIAKECSGFTVDLSPAGSRKCDMTIKNPDTSPVNRLAVWILALCCVVMQAHAKSRNTKSAQAFQLW